MGGYGGFLIVDEEHQVKNVAEREKKKTWWTFQNLSDTNRGSGQFYRSNV